MSGLGEFGELPGFVTAGGQAQPRDLDLLVDIGVDSPSVSASWFGTSSGTVTASTAITKINQPADWPRNPCYTVVGGASGTFGGTFTANYLDQFGSAVTEKVAIAAAVNGGTVYGTVIAAKFLSGSFISQGSSGGSAGTAQIGFGTVSNGGSQSNWFGLLYRIQGTSDVKSITWVTTNTPTTLNAGTNFGTLVGFDGNGSVPSNAFQGTSGVAITDHYKVLLKPTFDSVGRGPIINL